MVAVVRARQEGRRRLLRGRARSGSPTWAPSPLRATAAEEALRGEPLDAQSDRGGRRAGGRGHRAAGRPQRLGGLQAPPGARAVPARARGGGGVADALGSADGRHAGPGRRGLPRRPGPRDGRLPGRRRSSSRCCSRARRASARPRSRGRSRPRTGARLIRLQCHEGIDLHHARLRLGLRAPAARDPRGRGRAPRRASCSAASSCCGARCCEALEARRRRRCC